MQALHSFSGSHLEFQWEAWSLGPFEHGNVPIRVHLESRLFLVLFGFFYFFFLPRHLCCHKSKFKFFWLSLFLAASCLL